MTTTVTIKVNGNYRAKVRQDNREPVTVEGNYPGSSNPTGEQQFNIQHGPSGTKSIFEVEEETVQPGDKRNE